MTNKELTDAIDLYVKQQGNQTGLAGVADILSAMLRMGEINGKPGISIERLRPYLYRVTFDAYPEDNGADIPMAGACSAYVQNGKLYRNLDFYYNNTASFLIRTRDFEGMSFVTGLDDGKLDYEGIGQLPYQVVDGRNNNGIMVSTHILFNDWAYKGAGERNIPLTRLPFLVLTKVKSMATIADDLADILGNLSVGDKMGDYLIQVLVTDGTTTYALLPPDEDGQSYVCQDITSNPKLTNFRWLSDAEVTRSSEGMQTRPTGIERFNLMPCPLKNLRFTLCYEDDDRLSEFIGIRETTKESTDVELEAIYNEAHELYLNRKRDSQTWQTVHSAVYGTSLEELYIQENWDDNCVAGNLAEQIGNLAELDTENKTSLVKAINEVFGRHALLIQSESDTTVSGYAVPSLTAEQVQQAYNAVVAGRGCIIVDHDEKMHAYVNQADALNDEISIAILFYSTLILTYTLSNGAVTITSVEL